MVNSTETTNVVLLLYLFSCQEMYLLCCQVRRPITLLDYSVTSQEKLWTFVFYVEVDVSFFVQCVGLLRCDVQIKDKQGSL